MAIIGIDSISTTDMLCWSCNKTVATHRVSCAVGAATVKVCVCEQCANPEDVKRVINRYKGIIQ